VSNEVSADEWLDAFERAMAGIDDVIGRLSADQRDAIGVHLGQLSIDLIFLSAPPDKAANFRALVNQAHAARLSELRKSNG
jgi:hypothetical protein